MSSSFVESPQKPAAGGPLADLRPAFERGAHVVEAAAAALGDLEGKLGALRVRLTALSSNEILRAVTSLESVIDRAGVDGENLLIQRRDTRNTRPLVVFALSRTADGALSAQPIEIDRKATALTDGQRHESDFAYDRLVRAAYAATTGGVPAGVRETLDALARQIRMASSRLAIAKARFDLQSSALRSVAGESPKPMRSAQDAARDARDMAVEARRLLDRAALNILKNSAPAAGASAPLATQLVPPSRA